MRTIGVGLIGTGFMGKAHAVAFNSVSSVFGDILRPKLRILCDVDAERTQSKAEEFGFERWTTDWRKPDDPWSGCSSLGVASNGMCLLSSCTHGCLRPFYCCRDYVTAVDHRVIRVEAFKTWTGVP